MPRQLPAFSLLTNEVVDRMSHLFFLFRRLNEERMGRLFAVFQGCDLVQEGRGYYVKKYPGL